MAAHMVRAHASVLTGTEVAEPTLPTLWTALSPAPTSLPGNASVPPLAIEGADLSGGLTAAFPGYADLRLLAPNAELRLLLAGISQMVNPHNIRWVHGWADGW